MPSFPAPRPFTHALAVLGAAAFGALMVLGVAFSFRVQGRPPSPHDSLGEQIDRLEAQHRYPELEVRLRDYFPVSPDQVETGVHLARVLGTQGKWAAAVAVMDEVQTMKRADTGPVQSQLAIGFLLAARADASPEARVDLTSSARRHAQRATELGFAMDRRVLKDLELGPPSPPRVR